MLVTDAQTSTVGGRCLVGSHCNSLPNTACVPDPQLRLQHLLNNHPKPLAHRRYYLPQIFTLSKITKLVLGPCKLLLATGAAYEEAVISLQGSSMRFFWKEIKAKFKGGYLIYPPKSTPGKLTVGTATTVR